MSDADMIREFIDTRDLDPEVFAALDRLVLALTVTERERDKALLSVEGLSKRLAIALAPREET